MSVSNSVSSYRMSKSEKTFPFSTKRNCCQNLETCKKKNTRTTVSTEKCYARASPLLPFAEKLLQVSLRRGCSVLTIIPCWSRCYEESTPFLRIKTTFSNISVYPRIFILLYKMFYISCRCISDELRFLPM